MNSWRYHPFIRIFDTRNWILSAYSSCYYEVWYRWFIWFWKRSSISMKCRIELNFMWWYLKSLFLPACVSCVFCLHSHIHGPFRMKYLSDMMLQFQWAYISSSGANKRHWSLIQLQYFWVLGFWKWTSPLLMIEKILLVVWFKLLFGAV